MLDWRRRRHPSIPGTRVRSCPGQERVSSTPVLAPSHARSGVGRVCRGPSISAKSVQVERQTGERKTDRGEAGTCSGRSGGNGARGAAGARQGAAGLTVACRRAQSLETSAVRVTLRSRSTARVSVPCYAMPCHMPCQKRRYHTCILIRAASRAEPVPAGNPTVRRNPKHAH
jgi:hypothetical protein